MADETPPKRVLPARERRESAAKRRASSPVVTPVVSSTVKKTSVPSTDPLRQKRKYVRKSVLVKPPTASNASSPSATEFPEEVLPTRFISSKPLPTTRQQQNVNLSDREYQTIAESAVLAASLHKSRMQWLCDGILQKYWTKPVKKKGVTDVPPDNPDPKSMHKLGNGTITVAPHTFEVMFYTVRDPQQPMPYYRHPNQHTSKPLFPPPNNFGIYPLPPAGPTPSTSKTTTPQPGPRSTQPSTQAATPAVKQEHGLPSNPHAIPAAANQSQHVQPPVPATQPSAPPLSTSASPAPKPKPDPVIQMLAARAASDPKLKDLMKVVATSKASPDQLKEFQSHIDEFNAVVRRQEVDRSNHDKQTTAATNGPPKQAQPKIASPAPNASPGAAHPAMYNLNAGRGGPLTPAARSALSGSIPPYVGFTPPTKPEPIIKHIVVEFTTNASANQPASADRWLFPEHAVLDIKYGGLEMICSFFVERSGASILAALGGESPEEKAASQAKWKANQDYYQPITITVKVNHHRTIESIARAAKPLPAVQEHMKEVMKNKIRVTDEFLVHRLPRDKIQDFVDSGVELGSDDEDIELKDWYGNV